MAETTMRRGVENGGAMLFRLIRSLVVMENDEARCCGVTTGQGLALLAMKSGEPVTMGLVTEALGVSAGTATRVVDNLVRGGLVERAENPLDRRSVCVAATPNGRKTIAELDLCYQRFSKAVFDRIAADRLPGTLAALELLVEAVEQAKQACCVEKQS